MPAESVPSSGQASLTWSRAILHVDMDAFYVNVHLLAHPEDKGLPLAVGGRPGGRGVVASASYEARQFGVRSAMPAGQAARLCPGLKFVHADWTQIRANSRQIMRLLAEFGPVEQMSVDEAYIDLAERQRPETVARQVQGSIKSETGLPASVGLATSKLVAKVASDHDKPYGCTIVLPGEEATFLAPLPVRAIWGIGPRTAERLAELGGIETCGQLAAADLTPLRAILGRRAEETQQRARGIDDRRVHSERGPAKSISQERTFSSDIADANFLRDQLRQMSQTVVTTLQGRRLLAYTVTVKFRLADFTTFSRQKTMAVATDDAAIIARLAESIWEEHWPSRQRMRLIGVGVSNLVQPAERQLGLGF